MYQVFLYEQYLGKYQLRVDTGKKKLAIKPDTQGHMNPNNAVIDARVHGKQ